MSWEPWGEEPLFAAVSNEIRPQHGITHSIPTGFSHFRLSHSKELLQEIFSAFSLHRFPFSAYVLSPASRFSALIDTRHSILMGHFKACFCEPPQVKAVRFYWHQ